MRNVFPALAFASCIAIAAGCPREPLTALDAGVPGPGGDAGSCFAVGCSVDGGGDGDVDGGGGDAGPAHDDGGTARDDAGAPVDAGAPPDDGGAPLDAGTSCAAPVPDYTCTPGDPASCPGGECWFGSCVGPQVDHHRYDACGDGVCTGCDDEPAVADDAISLCPADCDPELPIAPRLIDDDDSLTIFVHGIHIEAAATIAAATYGQATDGEGLGTSLLALDPTLVDGSVDPTAPRQIVGVEFYGTHPDPSLTADDIAFIEAIPYDTPQSIERYARVVARFTAHRLADSGAHSLHFLCHSMGCTVVRFLVEHDLSGLASDGRLTRVATVAGAVQGADMANMVDNPFVQQYAALGAFNIWDMSALDPDHVRDVVAIWNHDLGAADNPTWRGIDIHSIGGSDPTLAFNVFSLDAVHNPDELPCDGVVFTLESFFPRERLANRIVSVEGNALMPSHSILDQSHNAITQDAGAGLIVHAALFDHTKVVVRLTSITLVNDHEHHAFLDGEFGDAPAEVAAESRISLPRSGVSAPVLIDERTVGQHTPDITVMNAGDTAQPNVEIFSGPLPDDQTAMQIDVNLVEVDWYKRFAIAENAFAPTTSLATFSQLVPIAAGTYAISGADASGTLEVTVDHVP